MRTSWYSLLWNASLSIDPISALNLAKKVSIRSGTSSHDLIDITAIELNEPVSAEHGCRLDVCRSVDPLHLAVFPSTDVLLLFILDLTSNTTDCCHKLYAGRVGDCDSSEPDRLSRPPEDASSPAEDPLYASEWQVSYRSMPLDWMHTGRRTLSVMSAFLSS